MHWLDYLVLLGYFLVLVVIGYLSSLRIKRQEDFFMGGRSFGKLLQTFAAFGAGTGSSDPVNTGRTTFAGGMSGMWSVMYWLFVTPFYWITGVWYRRMRHLTLGDWFVERYESRALGAAYCAFGLLFFMVYGSMFFSAIAKVALPLIGTDHVVIGGQPVSIEYVMVPLIGLVVLVYGIAGGLRAAYYTDLIQGCCIIGLSIMLIPFGLQALVDQFSPGDNMMAGFRIMHQQLPEEYFTVVGSTTSSEFPLHRILAIVAINLVGIVVQPHFIATGGGSAKTETSARVGLVLGNFLKRFCTIGWVLTGLIAVALFANARYPELVEDPDQVWGVASRELLGPGLTGLMLACLLAALMSSVDAYMIVGSGLVVRNVYAAYVNPHASEREYVTVGRLTGALVVAGAVLISLTIFDMFEQLQLTWVFPVLFAAPFWIGMYWRRATRTAAWVTVLYCAATFFLVPWLAPKFYPQLRQSLSDTNDKVTTTTARQASPADVLKRDARIALWDARFVAFQEALAEVRAAADIRGRLGDDSRWQGAPAALLARLTATSDAVAELTEEDLAAVRAQLVRLPELPEWKQLAEALERLAAAGTALEKLGPRPVPMVQGQLIHDVVETGGRFLFWEGGTKPAGAETVRTTLTSGEWEIVADGSDPPRLYNLRTDPARATDLATQRDDIVDQLRSKAGSGDLDRVAEVLVVTERYTGSGEGSGNLKLDLLLFRLMGVRLSGMSNATLDTLELPFKIVTPFLVMILVSLITRRNSDEALDRYYTKMKTPVDPDPETDRLRLYDAYENRAELEKRKLFPGTSLEFSRPTWVDISGFVICVAVCFGIIALAMWVARLGA